MGRRVRVGPPDVPTAGRAHRRSLDRPGGDGTGDRTARPGAHGDAHRPPARRRCWRGRRRRSTGSAMVGSCSAPASAATPVGSCRGSTRRWTLRVRAKLLDDGLEHMDRWWRGEEANGVRLLPQPVQRPRIPVWVASRFPNPAPVRRAARWDGWFPIGLTSPDDLVVQLAYGHRHRPSRRGIVGRRGARSSRRGSRAVGRRRRDVVAGAVRAVRSAGRARARSRRGGSTHTMTGRHIAVVGTTASGKSALAFALRARHPDLEIVSIDSMQVYRGMDIGTAKPAPAERAEVPHHLIDLVDPDEEFTSRAVPARVRRRARGDRSATSPRPPRRRDRPLPARRDRRAHHSRSLSARTAGTRRRADRRPARTSSLPSTRWAPRASTATNRRRIVRALEVTVGSGRPFSSFGPGLEAYPPTPFVLAGIALPPGVVAARIEARYRRQLDDGFVDEVRRLLARPRGLSRTAGQALGYKELAAHLAGHVTLDEAIDAGRASHTAIRPAAASLVAARPTDRMAAGRDGSVRGVGRPRANRVGRGGVTGTLESRCG